MEVRNLAEIAFEDLVICFLKAFKNYFVEMPTDLDYYRNRFTAARVRYDLSYGMFHEGELVGFIVHGIDRRNGLSTILKKTGRNKAFFIWSNYYFFPKCSIICIPVSAPTGNYFLRRGTIWKVPTPCLPGIQ